MLLLDEYTQLYKQEFSTHGYDEILYPHSVKHFVKETQPKMNIFITNVDQFYVSISFSCIKNYFAQLPLKIYLF